MASYFERGTFFPDPTSDVKPYNQCLDYSANMKLPMFARDLSGNGSKTFICCGYNEFVKTYYKKQKTKNMYEIVLENRPCRIFLDFDEKDTSKREDFDHQCDSFIQFMIKTHFSDLKDVSVHTMVANTNKKCSRHVVIDIFLTDFVAVKNLVEHCLEKSPCPYVDRLIYTKNRSFRLLYSKKFGADDKSTLRDITDLSDSYDPSLLLKTMIQAFDPNKHKVIEIEISRKRAREGENNNTYKRCTASTPHGLHTFVSKYNGATITSSGVEVCDGLVRWKINGMVCPNIGRVHSHNHTYMYIVKKSGFGYFQCADAECKQYRFSNFDAKYFL